LVAGIGFEPMTFRL